MTIPFDGTIIYIICGCVSTNIYTVRDARNSDRAVRNPVQLCVYSFQARRKTIMNQDHPHACVSGVNTNATLVYFTIMICTHTDEKMSVCVQIMTCDVSNEKSTHMCEPKYTEVDGAKKYLVIDVMRRTSSSARTRI